MGIPEAITEENSQLTFSTLLRKGTKGTINHYPLNSDEWLFVFFA